MKRDSKVLLLLVAMTGMVMMSACSRDTHTAYSAFVKLPDAGWSRFDGKEFLPFDYGDSIPSGDYRLVIVMRHTDRFRYTRLWIELEQADSTGIVATDTIGIDIAREDGRFIGKGHFGLFEVADTLCKRVNVSPGWQLSVRHIMQEEDVAGLNDIGLILLQ